MIPSGYSACLVMSLVVMSDVNCSSNVGIDAIDV